MSRYKDFVTHLFSMLPLRNGGPAAFWHYNKNGYGIRFTNGKIYSFSVPDPDNGNIDNMEIQCEMNEERTQKLFNQMMLYYSNYTKELKNEY
jgi:hypothetical protein